MPKPTVFVSHSHKDNDWCRQFVAALQRLGYDVWYDEKGLSGGAQWVKTIEHELESREVFAIILTPESVGSNWVQRELQSALTTERRIVPILLKDAQVSGFLRTYQWIDAKGGTSDTAAHAFDGVVSPRTSPPPVDPLQNQAGWSPPSLVAVPQLPWAAPQPTLRVNSAPTHQSNGLGTTAQDMPAQIKRGRLFVEQGNSEQPIYELNTSNVRIMSRSIFKLVSSDREADAATRDSSEAVAIIERTSSGFSVRSHSINMMVNGAVLAMNKNHALAHRDITKVPPNRSSIFRTAVTLRFEYI